MHKCAICKKSFPRNQVYARNYPPFPEYYCRGCNTKHVATYRATAKGKKAINEASKRSYIKNKEKWLARSKARYAVKIGKLIKPDRCEVCEKKAAGHALQGHHEDYSKPLEVTWLCISCHADADRELESKNLPTTNPLNNE